MDLIGWVAFIIAAGLVLFMAVLAVKVVLIKDKLDQRRTDKIIEMKKRQEETRRNTH